MVILNSSLSGFSFIPLTRPFFSDFYEFFLIYTKQLHISEFNLGSALASKVNNLAMHYQRQDRKDSYSYGAVFSKLIVTNSGSLWDADPEDTWPNNMFFLVSDRDFLEVKVLFTSSMLMLSMVSQPKQMATFFFFSFAKTQ